MANTVEELSKDVAANTEFRVKVTKVLFGNGEEGMDEILRSTAKTVTQLSTSFEDYKKSQDEVKKSRAKDKESDKKQLKYIVIASIIPYAVSFVVWIVYWFTRLQPLLEQLDKAVK